MTLAFPWQFSQHDPAGKELEDRLQDVLDVIATQFPVGVSQVSQVAQARVYNNAALVIPNAAATALTFNSEHWDTASLHDSAVNPSRLTCVTAGLHIICAHVEWAANAAGFRQVYVRVNGATPIASELVPTAAGGAPTEQSVSTSYRLAAGDYVEAVVQQTSGANLNVNSTGNFTPEFSMHWVSP